MVVNRNVLKTKPDSGVAGAALLFSILGFGCLPLGIIGWAMGKPGSVARIVGIVATIVQVILICVVAAGAVGWGNAAREEQPPPPPSQFFDEETPKQQPKK